MIDPLEKRRTGRIASAVALGVAFPLLVLAMLWPDVGLVTVVLVATAGALLAFLADSKLHTLSPREEMIGREGMVAYLFRRDANGVYLGNVQIGTESWTARTTPSNAPRLTAGRKVRVTGIDGLVLEVEPLDKRE